MASNRDRRTQPSVAQKLFGDIYVPFIADMNLKRYGGSYACYQNQRNTWRANISYTAEIEQEFILETKTFIRCLDHYVNKLAENPQFLMAFIKLAVDYLSAYTMKNPAFPGRTRKKAKEALMQTLWYEFKYIKLLLARQAVQRSLRKERNVRYLSAELKKANEAAAYQQVKATQRRLASGRAPKQK